jgi:hypothetical protein
MNILIACSWFIGVREDVKDMSHLARGRPEEGVQSGKTFFDFRPDALA